MKKFLKMAMACTLVLGALAGCSTSSNLENKPAEQSAGNTNAGGGEAGGKVTIGLAVSTLNNPFFVSLKEGAEKAAKDAGAELLVVDAQDDTAKQISGVEDLIQKKVSVIMINPTDSAAIVTAVEAANKANIPVITVDRAAEGGQVVSHIASDNVKGGKMAGDFILEKLGGKGNIVELQGIAGTSAARDRGKGFHDAVDGKEGVKVVASQPADFDRAKGLSVMENILQANKDVQAVFAHNDEMALGALQAVEAAGKDIVVVGFDATDDAVKSVNDGKMGATVAQKPAAIGETAVQTALKVAKGEKVESNIPVDLELVTKK
ncbi:ribose ABC transporter substrate-binding protein RbsB [Brevibacillus centrosporus]|uniref:ribose ABC transporter substrate-binding protein RbsB n=1 Tax=Brevibacillus centrosporus TaxID=54910 RepID=UPI000F0A961F|nr:ribose ABC transporter substrate-binding protein RbsB [Brevibacillus centrosporus]MEC2129749.1 ribose ABC transporter substrate-binding protein RbsB [Brevibacillus centrosporus]RNB67189.1 ribose ABC transporter substrate-binding protein RbsB [Brevibacillus centrosporus]GED32897.1 D-ribose ABC transporter substrate-binding protein [Brevibacillus centrosporus]